MNLLSEALKKELNLIDCYMQRSAPTPVKTAGCDSVRLSQGTLPCQKNSMPFLPQLTRTPLRS